MGRYCWILNEKKEELTEIGKAYVFEDIVGIKFREPIERVTAIDYLEIYRYFLNKAINFLKSIEDEKVIFADENYYFDIKFEQDKDPNKHGETKIK